VRSASRAWPDFRRLWAAHSVSIFGDQLTLVALPVATYAETESALAVGVVASAEAATAVIFGLPAGALADRLPYRRVLVLTDLGRLAILGALLVSIAFAGSSVASLLAAAVGLGVVRVVHDAAAAASVPMVVPDERLNAANGRLQASEAASTAIGPALAGALIAAGGTSLAFGVDAATFALSGATLASLRRLDDAPPPVDLDVDIGRLARLRHDVADGIRQLWRDRPMRRIVTIVAAMNILAVAVEAQFIPYAREVLDIGALGIGAYFALGGTVAVVTSLLAGRTAAALGGAIVLGVGVFAAGVLVAGVAPSYGAVALAYIGAGFGSALVTTHLATFRQRRFPQRSQGRLSMAVRALIVAPMPVGFIAGGWLASNEGPEVLFVVAGVIGLGASLWGLVNGTARLREG
jgi:MFS family permease